MKRLIFLFVLVALVISPLALVHQPAEAGDDAAAISWYGEYYDNAYLLGTPKVTRYDRGINFNWGTQIPATGMPADNFTVRWTARPTFDAATYRFYMTADDGANVTIDFQHRIFATIENTKPGQTFVVDVPMTAGQHHVQVDYREWTGNAYINFYWQKLDAAGNPVGTPTSPTIPTLPSDRAAAYVNTYELNVRQGPSVGYSIIATQRRYAVVTLIGRNSDATWVKATLSNGSQGWMSAAYLVGNVGFSSLPLIDAAGNPTTPPPAPSAGALSATVVAGRLNVRYGPGMGYGIFTVVTSGQSLEVIARDASGIWAKVRLSNGAIAWVSVAYLRVNGNFYALPTANS